MRRLTPEKGVGMGRSVGGFMDSPSVGVRTIGTFIRGRILSEVLSPFVT